MPFRIVITAIAARKRLVTLLSAFDPELPKNLITVLDNENNRDKIIEFSRIDNTLGVNALSEKMGSQNKNIGDNGSGSATCSEYSTERFTEKIAGILSF